MRRILSLVLTLAIVVAAFAGMQLTSSAAPKTEIIGMSDNSTSGWGVAPFNGTTFDLNQLQMTNYVRETFLELGDTRYERIGGILIIIVPQGMFAWKDGKMPLGTRASATLRERQFSEQKIKWYMTEAKGMQGVALVSMFYEQLGMYCIMIGPMKSGESRPFDFTLWMSVNGKQYKDYALHLTGTQVNDIYYLDETETEISLPETAGHTILKTDTIKRDISVELGCGVTLHSSMIPGREYYAYASKGSTSGVTSRAGSSHPGLAHYISLTTGNYPEATTKVSFDLMGLESVGYYVYTSAGKYLGRSNEMLPYSASYYFYETELPSAESAPAAAPAEAPASAAPASSVAPASSAAPAASSAAPAAPAAPAASGSSDKAALKAAMDKAEATLKTATADATVAAQKAASSQSSANIAAFNTAKAAYDSAKAAYDAAKAAYDAAK